MFAGGAKSRKDMTPEDNSPGVTNGHTRVAITDNLRSFN